MGELLLAAAYELGQASADAPGRLVEIALAAVILSGSVMVGHELRAWRSWYGDPTTTHPWTATPPPSDSPVAEPASR